MMSRNQLLPRLFLHVVLSLAAGAACAQDYPEKPIRLLTSAAGGSPDFVSRVLAQGLAPHLRQPLVVDNRSSGLIPAEFVARAAPDGYTLLVTSNAMWVLTMFQSAPYDPISDFSPISSVSMAPTILVVHPTLPVESVKQLIALAKARPGALSYASSTTGTASHLAGELFKIMAGVNIVRIPYKGAGLATADLISGQVQLSFFTATSVLPHVKAGKLKALAVTSAQPFELFPNLPTVASAGLPGYQASSLYCVFAPAKTPEAIVSRLNREMVQFLNTPAARSRLLNAGSVAAASTPDQLLVEVKSDMERVRRVVTQAGIRRN